MRRRDGGRQVNQLDPGDLRDELWETSEEWLLSQLLLITDRNGSVNPGKDRNELQ